ncbi:NAD(P)-binding protein [Rhodobacterales bacterium HKCCE3408]|nr:NAD(P)-binding protein [Rhodobacterales bacterium HKCCE3408]
MTRPVTILGAGIGGLAAAAALAQRGWQVTVLERAPALTEIGAGIQVSPNGTRVLGALGLDTSELGDGAAGVVLRNGATGAQVARLPFGYGFRLCHRADLLAVLAQTAEEAGAKIETGVEIARVEPGPDAVTLTTADGATRSVPVLIGADGLQSVTKRAVAGGLVTRFTGQVAWRALVEGDPGLAPEPHVFMGDGRHLVRYPLRGGRLVNIVAVEERDEWTEEGWHHEDDPAALRAAFRGFCPEVTDLLDRVGRVNLWGLFRHPVAPHWFSGRAVLIGDAAHPTLPFLAQGANMALEDAWVLAGLLDTLPPPEAFATYQLRRRRRVERIVAAAEANATNYHLAPGLKRSAAHTALRLGSRLAPQLLLGRFDWLYGHDVTRT